ncbi:hypothetical protein E4656_19800 [Natronospirillum operosum]|uniref:Uncharacterized protein n=1 Tax=Natronospirillum operosum TaxID=2759953 RepID=A0A4Z0W0X0_9GAMM|nr:hypothetical protein [Natronospirillum operosum]TGG89983.1 hypothetical protein E4656_19800 [Natronospirillum operosum]
MSQQTCSQLQQDVDYQPAFLVGSALTGQSQIPAAYRWSGDRIRTEKVSRQARAARALWVRQLLRCLF